MERRQRTLRAAAYLAPFVALIGIAPAASAQEPSDAAAPERLGSVRFETSCSPAVADAFDRGVALLHSFWFGAARETFEGIVAENPACAMAWWGVALAHWGNPFGGYRSPEALEAGSAAAAKAGGAGEPTPRERGYIAAVSELYRDHASVQQRDRILAYEASMAKLVAEHPDDDEAAIFYALALAQSAPPTDKTYAKNLAAAEILERLAARHPDHPGIAHYLIHSYDVPALAPRALEAAERYSEIAPSIPHALHMPSHTFTRVGKWNESIHANQMSAAAADQENAIAEELHALDYQLYAYLQRAQDAEASRVIKRLPELEPRLSGARVGSAPAPAGWFALAAMPARYALEREEWDAAAALPVRTSPFAWPEAVTHFARGLGAARAGRSAAAREEVARLAAVRDTLSARKEGYWSDQAEIQRLGVEAWALYAEGAKDEALDVMRSAAEREDATEKHAVTPGPLAPARELLGEMLLALGRPEEALREFESTLTREPRRFRTLLGAARAAHAAGDAAAAARYAGQLLEVADQDARSRPELDEARRWAAET